MVNVKKSIWKYVLVAETVNTIEVPLGTELLSAEAQGEEIVVYALVNTNETSNQKIEIRTYGTGHEIDVNITDYKFLGTAKLYNGSLMSHVFYRTA